MKEKVVTFNIEKEGTFFNTEFGELKLIEPTTQQDPNAFNFGDEEDLSDLLLEDEFIEEQFGGLEEEPFEVREQLQNIDMSTVPAKTEPLSVDYNDPKFVVYRDWETDRKSVV